MTEKTILNKLTQNGVVFQKITTTEVEGEQVEVSRWHRAYTNSIAGRTQMQAEVDEPYKTAIMTVWGDTPTVDEDAQ